MGLIISIDGRVCSGKSTLICLLKEKIEHELGIKFLSFSCGTHYREVLKYSVPSEKVDDAMVSFISSIYKDFEFAFIDGRSVGFCLKTETAKQIDKNIFSVLLDVNKELQYKRVSERHYGMRQEAISDAINRDTRDQERCMKRYGLDIFQKRNYDFYLDTSDRTPEEACSILFSKIRDKLLQKVENKTI